MKLLMGRRVLSLAVAVVASLSMTTGGRVANASPVMTSAAPIAFTIVKQAAPSADTYVAQNFSSKNYGSSQSLATYGTPDIVSYLRFHVPAGEPGQTLVGAALKLKTTTAASDGSNDTVSVRRAGDGWDEQTLTYPGRPPAVGGALGAISSDTVPNTVYVIELATAQLTGVTGRFSMAISSSGSDSFRFYSSESPFYPILELTFRGPLPPLDPPTAGATRVVMAAGDLVCPPGTTVTSTTCKHQVVHDVIVGANPYRFLALGDLAQGVGSYDEFMAPGRYHDTFGHLRNITLPVVGNHEGYTAQAKGYFDYWYGSEVNSGAFGDRLGGYYTTTVGSWRFIGLNSECAPYKSSGGGCGVGSPQYRWLESVLARNTAACTVAAYHLPRWTTGAGTGPYVEMASLWDLMATKGVDLVLSGHVHSVEIFKPIGASGTAAQPSLSPLGIRSFTIGTGGASHSTFTAPGAGQFAALTARARGTFGALRLELRPAGFSWNFLPVPGATVTNAGTNGSFSGSASCH